MAKQRHSTPELPAPRPKLTPEQEARQAAENGFRQFDRLRQLIREGVNRYEKGCFELRISTLMELAKLAVEGTVDAPGHLRRGQIKIEGSKHSPPDSDCVMVWLEDMCEYVNSNFGKSAWHLAAYVMWRLNWIHPFEDGNGRTARAVAYLLLCVRSKFELPGTTTVPELIAQDKEPYYQALEAADQASIKDPSVVDVSQMELLLRDLLIRQLDAAAGGSPRSPQIEMVPTKSPETFDSVCKDRHRDNPAGRRGGDPETHCIDDYTHWCPNTSQVPCRFGRSIGKLQSADSFSPVMWRAQAWSAISWRTSS
jgi:hypothetical protein